MAVFADGMTILAVQTAVGIAVHTLRVLFAGLLEWLVGSTGTRESTSSVNVSLSLQEQVH